MDLPIAGITFHFVDRNWKLRSIPISFFDTEDLGKVSEDNEQIIRSSISKNDLSREDVLIFSGTSDN